MASAIVFLALMLRDQNVRTAPLATALRSLPAALIMASLLNIGAFGNLIAASAIFDRVPRAHLDFFISGLLLLGPHLLSGTIVLPLVRFSSRPLAASPVIVGVASVLVILLAVFQQSLLRPFS